MEPGVSPPGRSCCPLMWSFCGRDTVRVNSTITDLSRQAT